MHTPEQAKDLWCPMVRIARHEVVTIENPAIGGITSVHEEHHVVGGVNHDALGAGNKRIAEGHQPLASCRCIADKCSMWRWVRTTRSEPTTTEISSGVKARTYDIKVVQSHGYCGIAGHPEVI